jgi:hypothetical protein
VQAAGGVCSSYRPPLTAVLCAGGCDPVCACLLLTGLAGTCCSWTVAATWQLLGDRSGWMHLTHHHHTAQQQVRDDEARCRGVRAATGVLAVTVSCGCHLSVHADNTSTCLTLCVGCVLTTLPAGPYPSLHGLSPGSSLPGAPPLVGPAPGQQQQQPRPQPPPAAPQPGTSPYGSSGGGGYPSQLGGGSSSGVGAPSAARQPPAAAAAAAPLAGGSWSPGVAAALDAAVQAAAQGACKPSAAAISEAQKYAKFAVSSLNHDDVSGAVKFLSDALKALSRR